MHTIQFADSWIAIIKLSGTKLDRCCLTTQAIALSQETSGSLDRRARKFTAENIEKIKEWVARGVGRDEIADRLAVTPGSLTVTCSRLGISLRKISLAKGSGAIPPLGMVQRSIEHMQQGDDPARPKLTLVIQTQNRQAEFDLPLRRDLIEQLALEASVRGWTIGDLVGKIVTQVMEKNLDAAKTKMPSRGPRPARRPRRRALRRPVRSSGIIWRIFPHAPQPSRSLARRSICQRLSLARLSRISRNSFGPLRSLRLRRCRSSSGADGSIKRSTAWPAISRAFAARLGRPLAFCVPGVRSVAMIDLQ